MATTQASTATSITLELAGDAITLPIFADALSRLSNLLGAASTEVGAATVEWIIQDLAAGSAVATVMGVGASEEVVAEATNAVLNAAVALQDHAPLLPHLRIHGPMRDLTGILNGVVSDLTLISGHRVVTISSEDIEVSSGQDVEESNADAIPLSLTSIGRIVGTVRTVSHARDLRLEIRDERSGKILKSEIREELRDALRSVWDERAIVEGVITRDTRTGRPIKLRDVRRIELAPQTATGAFYRARGVLRAQQNIESPEETIRRIRDAN